MEKVLVFMIRKMPAGKVRPWPGLIGEARPVHWWVTANLTTRYLNALDSGGILILGFRFVPFWHL